MTSTIQFWMNLTLKNNLPKMDDQYIQFWMDHMLNNILPKMDDHIHPTLDDYCSFCSLYKESVSYSSKFGRISHVILKLPKVEEIGPSFSLHFWNWTIYAVMHTFRNF